MLHRRPFLLGPLSVVLARPLAAGAQQKVPRVGYLFSFTPSTGQHLWEACRQGLRELGYREGRSIVLEPRWADGRHEGRTGVADQKSRRAGMVSRVRNRIRPRADVRHMGGHDTHPCNRRRLAAGRDRIARRSDQASGRRSRPFGRVLLRRALRLRREEGAGQHQRRHRRRLATSAREGDAVDVASHGRWRASTTRPAASTAGTPDRAPTSAVRTQRYACRR